MRVDNSVYFGRGGPTPLADSRTGVLNRRNATDYNPRQMAPRRT